MMGKVIEIISGEDTCGELDALRTEINSFVSSELTPYNLKVQKYCEQHTITPFNTKNFYDAVWGTIAISESEILLLNSPILQRLRNIKQLGLADMLYSSANHSRFSHTLGVLHTASSMWQQISHELQKMHVTLDAGIEQIVRLAAILHDCGHMFSSHASERFFQNDENYSRQKDIQKIRNFFNRKLCIKPSLSEIISILIVNSDKMRELLRIVNGGFAGISIGNQDSENKLIEQICCLILGFPYSVDTIPYSQIISGQIDSDKLDYLKRDSHTTGVPVAVDMSRVFQKLRVVSTNQKYKMLSVPPESDAKAFRLGIAPAAINTVDQLVISRYMMFENIYFHQKVLTAEETLRYALRKIDRSSSGILNDFSVVLQLDDAQVINQNFKKSACDTLDCTYAITDQEEFDDAVRILKDLAHRILLKRCISFTTDNISDIGQISEDFYRDLFIDQNAVAQASFVESVINEVKEIKRLLSGEIAFKDTTDVLLVVSPEISSISLNSNIAIADKINRDRNMVFEADNWLKSRSTRKPQNYLVSYEEDRYIVFIAAEKVLFRDYGLAINDSIIYDEKDEAEISRIKRKLDNKDYYNDAYALLPNEEIARFNPHLEELVKNWQRYERFNLESGGRQPIDLTMLTSFIKQFYRFRDELGDFDVFVRGCVELLKKVVIISRNDIQNSLCQNIQSVKELANCEYDDIQICSLGTLQDSSSQIAYQMNEVNQLLTINNLQNGQAEIQYRVKRIDELTEKDVKPVMLFIEDAFSSATQIMSMFEEIMGIDISERQTQETHGVELPEEVKNKLKNSKLFFSFIFYNQENEQKFKHRLSELGLSDVQLVPYKEFPVGYFKQDNETDVEVAELTKKYFEKAGLFLLKEKAFDANGEYKPNWNETRVMNSLLGYNNAQQLIVFPWNTPTYTLTALWLSSRKEKWFPLFQRIDK